MSGARFTLRLASGEVVEDVRIQGRGGEVGADVTHCAADVQAAAGRRKVEAAIRLASKGRRISAFMYEPSPGHVLARPGPWRGVSEDELPARAVDIRGAVVLAVGPSRYETESDG